MSTDRTPAEPDRIGEHLERVADLLGDRDHPAPSIDDDVAAALAGGQHASGWRDQMWRDAIPSRFQWAKLDDFDGSAFEKLTDWAQAPRGRNLLIFGPIGVGKSRAAVAACRPAFFDDSREVRFEPVIEMFDALRPGGPDDYWDALAYADRLIIDDLGREKGTDWVAERVYALINRRWLEELPTVVPTNLTPDELRDAVGAAVYSRLTGGAVALQLSGSDRRRGTGTAR